MIATLQFYFTEDSSTSINHYLLSFALHAVIPDTRRKTIRHHATAVSSAMSSSTRILFIFVVLCVCIIITNHARPLRAKPRPRLNLAAVARDDGIFRPIPHSGIDRHHHHPGTPRLAFRPSYVTSHRKRSEFQPNSASGSSKQQSDQKSNATNPCSVRLRLTKVNRLEGIEREGIRGMTKNQLYKPSKRSRDGDYSKDKRDSKDKENGPSKTKDEAKLDHGITIVLDDGDLPKSRATKSSPGPVTIWTPEVMAASTALIPLILAVTVVCCLLLFCVLHWCTPREKTGITNNTFLTKVVKKPKPNNQDTTSANQEPVAAPGNQDPHGQSPAITVTSPTPESHTPRRNAPQMDGNSDEDLAPRGDPNQPMDLYMPYSFPQRRRNGMRPDSWHRGLLDLSAKRPNAGRSSYFRTFAPESLIGSGNRNETTNTSYVLAQASKRLQEVQNDPLSTVPGSSEDILTTPSPITNQSVWTLEGPRRASLTTALQDTECGVETLRDRRKGLRDNWLGNLFAERAPGTENLVILEQTDGAIRGASIGGRKEPESPEIAECWTPPVNVSVEVVENSVASSSNAYMPGRLTKRTKRHSIVRIQCEPEILGEISEVATSIPTPFPVSEGPASETAEVLFEYDSSDSKTGESREDLSSAFPNSDYNEKYLMEEDIADQEVDLGSKEVLNYVPPDKDYEYHSFPHDKNSVEDWTKAHYPSVNTLFQDNSTIGSMPMAVRAKLIEEAMDLALQRAVDDQVEEEELKIHLVPTLDGPADSSESECDDNRAYTTKHEVNGAGSGDEYDEKEVEPMKGEMDEVYEPQGLGPFEMFSSSSSSSSGDDGVFDTSFSRSETEEDLSTVEDALSSIVSLSEGGPFSID
ncbi:hypothetical protein FPQ18DRAFT_309852 [Pyronema domesticum]|nr:hypothetical protein FPQ18DRAFT_309852 [Pyronema domesticum]